MNDFTCKLVTGDTELQSAFEVRRLVFVQEQGVAEALEYDGLDDEALHVIAKDGDIVVGTSRVLFPTHNQAKIERMAVLQPFRRKGIGSAILSFVKQELRNRGIEHAVLHAQTTVIGFYSLHGFQETGSPFWEAGIEHMEMWINL
ncbi:MAG: GNAT family N-acetyltransferase [Dehalococcoidales bacterium]|nr:GNAT family N-acetyltransferase [Dehalococcoidales bacterium]